MQVTVLVTESNAFHLQYHWPLTFKIRETPLMVRVVCFFVLFFSLITMKHSFGGINYATSDLPTLCLMQFCSSAHFLYISASAENRISNNCGNILRFQLTMLACRQELYKVKGLHELSSQSERSTTPKSFKKKGFIPQQSACRTAASCARAPE